MGFHERHQVGLHHAAMAAVVFCLLGWGLLIAAAVIPALTR